MRKYDFGIFGPFDFERKEIGGQSVKTREFYYQLKDTIGEKNILILESTLYKKKPFLFSWHLLKVIVQCKYIVIFPAHNGIRFMAPILSMAKKFKNMEIHYNVIGGWLPDLLRQKTILRNQIAKFDTVLVETTVMKKDLEKQGLKNVYLLKNFKRLEPIKESKIKETSQPVRICFFSRVIKEKGIEDAIAAVNKINYAEEKCIFDIYGPVGTEYEKEFSAIKAEFSKSIRYCGSIMPSASTSVLCNYDIQLFPTKYPTEGIPGSIVDSYFSGVPVLAAKWNSFEDVVIDGVTGVGFELGNIDDLYLKLLELVESKDDIMRMKRECLKQSHEYMPNVVMNSFLKIIKNQGVD